MEERLLKIHWRMKRIFIENLHACECIKRYDRSHTFFYIDPPYYETTGYADPFGPEHFEQLRNTLNKLKGKFLLSLNDHPGIRRIFKEFDIETTTLKYSIGRTTASRGKIRNEVFIQNY